ncbi:MAG: hypothetical protein IKW58_02690 [Alphaproteobacteria bacterium]|nr:hypothetical protein [Alphaproteobacteria bacterium]
MDCKILKPTKFISKGATRICFEHPYCENLCVKVVVRSKDDGILFRELRTYNEIKYELKDYLVWHENEVVDTIWGKGVVCKLLKDDSGEYSKTLNYYKNKIDREIISQLYHFAYKLVEHNIFFYDFNLNNFTIQVSNGRKKLYYTDIKSFENYKPITFFRLEKLLTPLAKYLMLRRLYVLFRALEIDQ